MVNCHLCKIYKIVDLDSNECYVGSISEPTLARRCMRCTDCNIILYCEYRIFRVGFRKDSCTLIRKVMIDDEI